MSDLLETPEVHRGQIFRDIVLHPATANHTEKVILKNDYIHHVVDIYHL